MLILHGILAVAAVAYVAWNPRRTITLVVVGGSAVIDVSLGEGMVGAVTVVAPLLAFLAAALALAAMVEDSGLARRVALLLAAAARGNTLALYVLVCLLSALLTSAVSLDAAVVMMVPLLVALPRRNDALFGVLFLGMVPVANGASIMLPEGNPTNLVLMQGLGLSPWAFTTHMLLPGVASTMICGAGVAFRDRAALMGSYTPPVIAVGSPCGGERRALGALGAAALAGWGGLFVGVAPWWPFCAVVAVASIHRGSRPFQAFPWRVVTLVGALVITTQSLGLHPPARNAATLPALLVVTGLVSVAAALANNLPTSAAAAGLLAVGPGAYAASVGLAVGALATPQGSVATLIATDLAGSTAPPIPRRAFMVIAASAVLAATILLWLNA